MQPRGAGEDSTLATPPPRRSLVVPAFCPWTLPPRPPLPSVWGGLAGIQGPTAQLPTSWQGHTLGVSSGGRSGLEGHSPGNQAGEGTRNTSHPGGGAVVSRVPTSTSWPSRQGSPLPPQALPCCLLSALSCPEKHQGGALDPESGGEGCSPCPLASGSRRAGRERRLVRAS